MECLVLKIVVEVRRDDIVIHGNEVEDGLFILHSD